ncbi:GvpL/GvpF family gas vesicle protein, partial [Candidatus Aerophobetes bacterium]|nr:GvpL/GvpF family gas vesicle protein [Candidatus Aerophobetes bacterium]
MALYVYGIININRKKSFGPGGINTDEEVYTFPYQDIAGVVSNSSLPDLSSIFKETLGRYLIKHQQVIEKIMKEHIIIPMKFGTLAKDEGELKKVLARGYSQFKKLLTNMEGKIELDVACTWNDLNSIIKKIGEEDKEISQFKAEISKKPPQKAFEDRIKIGAMISEALGKKREKEKAEMINFLKGIILDHREHEVMNDQMILNCGLLLENEKEKEFENALE